MQLVRGVATWVGLGIVTLLGAYVLWRVFSGKLDLTYLIADKDGDASMGRFQLLIFTFVVALSFIYLLSAPGVTGFPEVPASVLTLIGISGSSFLLSKGIDKAP